MIDAQRSVKEHKGDGDCRLPFFRRIAYDISLGVMRGVGAFAGASSGPREVLHSLLLVGPRMYASRTCYWRRVMPAARSERRTLGRLPSGDGPIGLRQPQRRVCPQDSAGLRQHDLRKSIRSMRDCGLSAG